MKMIIYSLIIFLLSQNVFAETVNLDKYHSYFNIEFNQFSYNDRPNIVIDGDFNGDGTSDMIISDRRADINNIVDAGAVYLVKGNKNISQNDFRNKKIIMYGKNQNDKVGQTLQYLGDINNDGYSDLLVGTINKYYIVFGNHKYKKTKVMEIKSFSKTKKIESFNQVDFNKDGINDLALSISNRNSGKSGLYIYLGPIMPANKFNLINQKNFLYLSVNDAYLGDFNNDQATDFFVEDKSGKHFDLYYGSYNFPNNININLPQATLSVTNVSAEDLKIRNALITDINGDNKNDFIIDVKESYGTLEGVDSYYNNYIFLDSANLSGKISFAQAYYYEDGQWFSEFDHVASSVIENIYNLKIVSGDFNHDNIKDLAYSIPTIKSMGLNNQYGIIYIYYGREQWPEEINTKTADTIFLGGGTYVVQNNDDLTHYPDVFESGGDINSDGYDDLIIGATSYGESINENGRYYFLLSNRHFK